MLWQKDMTEEKHSLMTDLDGVFNEAGAYSWNEIVDPGFSRCLSLSQLWGRWLCCSVSSEGMLNSSYPLNAKGEALELWLILVFSVCNFIISSIFIMES